MPQSTNHNRVDELHLIFEVVCELKHLGQVSHQDHVSSFIAPVDMVDHQLGVVEYLQLLHVELLGKLEPR